MRNNPLSKRAKPVSKRAALLGAIRVAAYHNDYLQLVRLRGEHAVSSSVWWDEQAKGRAMKAAGVPCDCFSCKYYKTAEEVAK